VKGKEITMCKAFSCLVTRDGKVIWKAGTDSHDKLEKIFNVNPPKTPQYESDDSKLFARIEIVPDNKCKYPYLYPDSKWKLTIDERVKPDWLTSEHETKAWDAWKEWKQVIYQFNYKEALKPVNPLSRKHKPTEQDIELFKRWVGVVGFFRASVGASVGASVRASVRDSVWDSVKDSVKDSVWASVRDSVWDSVGDSVWASVRDSVWDSVGDSVKDSVWDSVWDSVGDSVWAYIGYMFPNIKEWKYIKTKDGEYPFQPAVDLWKRGFIASFDGTTWRLHSGKKAAIVYSILAQELKKE
jgi:hypothetical protein